MKNLLIALNAKYIHPNLAIRLLKKNTTYPTDIVEYTIKDDKKKIIDFIINNNYSLVGFSCYIWNIEYIKELISSLKKIKKDIIILLGGPEVSYNAKYYIENGFASYVIKNEGEEAYHLLLSFLDNKAKLNDIPNLYHKNGFTYDKLVDLSKAKMAYDLLDDVENKIMYIETSRGCPYKCGYCMASLDNKVRFFDIEEIKKQVLILINKKARVFKFLDRTFNANKKYFIDLINFIIANHHDDNSFQFEITGDLLDTDVIEYINSISPKNLFRFEIGIQSTNINTNLLVHRIQDNEKLFNNICLIQQGQVIDLHLDLIAGLPKEDYKSFQNTFNEVIALRPKELQLGFLKLLHGTALYKEADKYGYKWDDKAPYEIIENDSLSKVDIINIHIAEDAFEKYYNACYMPRTMNLILQSIDNPFMFFYNLGCYYKIKRTFGLDNLFFIIDSFINANFQSIYDKVHYLLILEYLEFHKLKPKSFWQNNLGVKEKNAILRQIHEDYGLSISLDRLYKYAYLVELKDCYLLAIYEPNNSTIMPIKKRGCKEINF